MGAGVSKTPVEEIDVSNLPKPYKRDNCTFFSAMPTEDSDLRRVRGTRTDAGVFLTAIMPLSACACARRKETCSSLKWEAWASASYVPPQKIQSSYTHGVRSTHGRMGSRGSRSDILTTGESHADGGWWILLGERGQASNNESERGYGIICCVTTHAGSAQSCSTSCTCAMWMSCWSTSR